jgi:hypothetical protein
MPTYLIIPDPKILVHVPLTGWRGWLNRYLRIPFPRPRVVVQDGSLLTCHPDNVPAVTEYLRTCGLSYRVQPREVAQ